MSEEYRGEGMDSADTRPYVRELDAPRLLPAMQLVLELMTDGRWRVYREIAEETGLFSEYISAHLRDLRKAKNGGYVVVKRPRGARCDGLWEFQLLPPGTESPYDTKKVYSEKDVSVDYFLEGMKHAARLIIAAADFETARKSVKAGMLSDIGEQKHKRLAKLD